LVLSLLVAVPRLAASNASAVLCGAMLCCVVLRCAVLSYITRPPVSAAHLRRHASEPYRDPEIKKKERKRKAGVGG
jgi:hypothetical protein